LRARVGAAADRVKALAAALPACEERVARLTEADLDVANAEKRDHRGLKRASRAAGVGRRPGDPRDAHPGRPAAREASVSG